MSDLLPVRHASFRSESRNPKHSMETCSRSTCTSRLVVPQRLFQSVCPSPNLLTGPERVPLPSKHPTSLRTEPPLDSSCYLRPIRMLLSRQRRTHRSLLCVSILTECCGATSHGSPARTDGSGLDIFKQSIWVEAVPRQQRSWVIFASGRTPWVCRRTPSLNLL
jgi:hypothetical protein